MKTQASGGYKPPGKITSPGGLHPLLALVLIVCAVQLLPGCSSNSAEKTLKLASGTTPQDTGLLDALLPMFREQTGIEVKVIPVGTGQALEQARRGDADVVLAHDPALEEKFMAEGFGASRHPVMYNDFVLVGPPDDPARIKGEKSIVQAFTQLAQKRVPFYSRGDESGTHEKEKTIWKKAGVEPKGDWYSSAGTGAVALLRIADQKQGYALIDRGTYLSQRKDLKLVILSEGDPMLLNRYHVIVVNAEKNPKAHVAEAEKLADFLQSPDARKIISDFGVDRYGEPLFHVDSGSP